jgi:DNA-binding NarL/FixJ family response regulator
LYGPPENHKAISGQDHSLFLPAPTELELKALFRVKAASVAFFIQIIGNLGGFPKLKSDMAAIRLALVDDHAIVRKGIRSLLEKSEQFEMVFESSTADELLQFIVSTQLLPDIVLLDIKIPGISALQAIRYLKTNFPAIKVVIFSMLGHIDVLAELIDAGAAGYISKSSDTDKLSQSLYYIMIGLPIVESSDNDISVKSINSHLKIKSAISDKDRIFLKLCATELSYEQIAGQMNVSPRTVNGYREKLFELLDIKSRSGLVLYAIRNGIAE